MINPGNILLHLQIRQIRREDLAALEWGGEFSHFRNLHQDAFRSSQRGEAVLWAAELPVAGIVGQLFVQMNSPRPELADGKLQAYIYAFRVRSAYRGLGIGRRLLCIAEADLIRRGFRRVVLNVSRENNAARQLYERSGYRIASVDPGRWSYIDQHGRRQTVNEPAWRMEKDLGPPGQVNDLLDWPG